MRSRSCATVTELMPATLSSARAARPKAAISPASVGKKKWYAVLEKNPNTTKAIKLRLRQNAIAEISSWCGRKFCSAELGEDASGGHASATRCILRTAPNSLKQYT